MKDYDIIRLLVEEFWDSEVWQSGRENNEMESRETHMQVIITDAFDLEKTAFCGQYFRAKRFNDGMYRFIHEKNVLYIKKLEETRYDVSCTRQEWDEIWTNYFDLGRNYRALWEQNGDMHPFIKEAVDLGNGLRILRQNPWEVLITFIISQRKNMAAIAKAVNLIAERYGDTVETPYEVVHLFPTAEQLLSVTKEGFSECGLGYRVPYVQSAVELVNNGGLDLVQLARYDDEILYETLLQVHGVGKKVANCVCLFGYGRTARVPIDVWIARVIKEEFMGENLFEQYGEGAGVLQQYVFYLMTKKK